MESTLEKLTLDHKILKMRLTTSNGLLFQEKEPVLIPRADHIAQELGFNYVEALVRYMKGNKMFRFEVSRGSMVGV